MRWSLILLVHICGGTLGMFSGFAAVFFRKGSRLHRLAGIVFVISMLTLASSGAYMALLKSQPGNVLGGALTFYLVATAWISAKPKAAATGIFDWCAVLVAFAVAAVNLTFAAEAANSQTGMKYGYPPGPYFFLGSVAMIAAAGDVRMLVRGGVSGTARIARHLWRMCFALFIAAGSIFLARQQLFPALFRKTGVLYLLSFLPLMLMFFWLIRIRFTNSRQKKSIAPVAEVYSSPVHPAHSLHCETPARG